MSTLSLFGEPEPEMKGRLRGKLRELAEQGVFIGTSSWKYDGWLGQIYTQERYRARGKFSQRKFEQECLAEYAETFPIVCGDFSFYQFPAPEYWARLFQAAPSLAFGLKVPEEVTVKIWPSHDRYGPRAGQANPSYLKADVLEAMFLEPLAPFHERVGVLIFEFGAFGRKSYEHLDEFIRDLDRFLAELPAGWRYAVEVRNPALLGPEYFGCLRDHRIAHVFNAWAKMPEIGSQFAVPGSMTADFTVARALLRAGRSYENAVKLFAPYTHIQDPNPQTRSALRRLIREARMQNRRAFVFVNNRLEGNAPETIAAIIEEE
jgi:uncharacterized protein YecE (DUF72 family)